MTVNNKLATAVSIALLSVAGSATAEVTLYDYTEATSAYEDAYLTGSFSANDGNGFDQSSYSATLGFDAERVFSSASRNTTIEADAAGSISRGSADGANSVSDFNAGIAGQVDTYFRPNSKGAFWYGAASLDAEKDQLRASRKANKKAVREEKSEKRLTKIKKKDKKRAIKKAKAGNR